MEKKLYKSSRDKVLAGVCGGIAEYFVVDSVIVRLLWVVFTLMGGAGLLAYIIAAIIVPSDNGGLHEDNLYPGNEQERRTPGGSRNTLVFLGIVFIGLACFLVIRNFIPWIPRDLMLAGLLLVLGVFFIVKRNG